MLIRTLLLLLLLLLLLVLVVVVLLLLLHYILLLLLLLLLVVVKRSAAFGCLCVVRHKHGCNWPSLRLLVKGLLVLVLVLLGVAVFALRHVCMLAAGCTGVLRCRRCRGGDAHVVV